MYGPWHIFASKYDPLYNFAGRGETIDICLCFDEPFTYISPIHPRYLLSDICGEPVIVDHPARYISKSLMRKFFVFNLG
jgi:hypothetical protein